MFLNHKVSQQHHLCIDRQGSTDRQVQFFLGVVLGSGAGELGIHSGNGLIQTLQMLLCDAHVADFLAIGDTFKVVEQAVDGMTKQEALKEENLKVMNSLFGPERTEKVRQQNSGTGTSLLKGGAEASSDDMDDDDLEDDILASIIRAQRRPEGETLGTFSDALLQ
jgi:hypothetical protein